MMRRYVLGLLTNALAREAERVNQNTGADVRGVPIEEAVVVEATSLLFHYC